MIKDDHKVILERLERSEARVRELEKKAKKYEKLSKMRRSTGNMEKLTLLICILICLLGKKLYPEWHDEYIIEIYISMATVIMASTVWSIICAMNIHRFYL